MRRAAEAGAVVLPAMPGFYHGVEIDRRPGRFRRGADLRSAGDRARARCSAGERASDRSILAVRTQSPRCETIPLTSVKHEMLATLRHLLEMIRFSHTLFVPFASAGGG